MFNILVTLTSFGPITLRFTKWLLKIGFGLVFTSFRTGGILWNESWAGIGVLKDLASYVIDNFESIVGIKVPTKDIQNFPPAGDDVQTEKASYFFTITGLIFSVRQGLLSL